MDRYCHFYLSKKFENNLRKEAIFVNNKTVHLYVGKSRCPMFVGQFGFEAYVILFNR